MPDEAAAGAVAAGDGESAAAATLAATPADERQKATATDGDQAVTDGERA